MKNYEQLGKESVESEFNFEWKEVAEGKVRMCNSLSEVGEDEALDKRIG